MTYSPGLVPFLSLPPLSFGLSSATDTQFQEWPFRERKSGPHVAFIFSAADEQKALWLVSPNVSRGDKSNIDPPSLRGLCLPTANF